MNKRIISVIISVLILLMTVPAFADDDRTLITLSPEERFAISDDSADNCDFEFPIYEDFGTKLEKNVSLRKSFEVVKHQSDHRNVQPANGPRTLGGAVDSEFRISDINSKDSFALQNQTGKTNIIGDNIGDEYIDPMTGNLIVKENDLSLPGVDGLDLNLSRYYSVSQAEVYEKSAGIELDPILFTFEDDGYIVTETVYNTDTEQTSTYQYPYYSYDAANIRANEIRSRNTHNGLFQYCATITTAEENDTVLVSYYYTSELNSSSYTITRNNLGAGWSWSFPSVQTIKTDYEDETEIPMAMYYHNGKGSVLEVGYDELNGCYFENYNGKDIEFDLLGYYNLDICSTARLDYMVEESDGTKYYFGKYGELRTIEDIYGNKITFAYTYKNYYGITNYPLLSQITDTVGRSVNFTYTTLNGYDYINVTVNSPVASEGSIQLSYKKELIDITINNNLVSSEPVLKSFTNSEGEITNYYPAEINEEMYDLYPVGFTFADKIFDSEFVNNTSGYATNGIYLLGRIIRPCSNTYYEYEICERNLGHSGVSEAYRITARGDDLPVVDSSDDPVNGRTENMVTYQYYDDYTGYPYYHSEDSLPDDELVCKTLENGNNASFERFYYKTDNAVLKKREKATYNNPVGSDLYVDYNFSSFTNKQPELIAITYSNESEYEYTSYVKCEFSDAQNKTYGKLLMVSDELDYDTATGNDVDLHADIYTYYSSTGFLQSKSRYRDSVNECVESYYYDLNKRPSMITKADGSSTEFEYVYSGGRLTQKQTTTSNESGTTVITENYTLETGYAYPSSVSKTVTGQNAEITTYTYNMLFGKIKTVTDCDGNVTSYEYDDLGRPTRIIYPQYSTYSSYSAKDIEILPVENITYQRVLKDYDLLTFPGQKLVARAITRTLSYYNVSGNTISEPTDSALSVLPKTYYGGSQKFYIGTGELIEDNVYDTVNDTNTLVTTTYYYDTQLNKITVKDAQGNTTTTQYDGLNREVKYTDEHNNYRIHEYNISGTGTGFKSKSFFGAQQENLVEYTYDRLGRVVNEKGYSDYPDEYSEIQYFYDFAGNVTGIIDPEENINSDGYTVKYVYDNLNRVVRSKNANNEVLRNYYDNEGNIKKQTITDPAENEYILYRRVYDGEGKLKSDKDNSNNSVIYTYNSRGQLVQSIDKDNKLYLAEYNESGIADSESHSIQEESLIGRKYAYKTPFGASTAFSAEGDYTPQGYAMQLKEIQNNLYSPAGRITAKISTYTYDTGISNLYFKPYIHHTYDSLGNLTDSIFACIDGTGQSAIGYSVHYEYDKRIVSKVQIDGSSIRDTSDSANVKYEYYPDGKLQSITFPPLSDNSILKTEYEYDGLSRVTSVVNKKGTDILSSYEYTYDKNNNVVSVEEANDTVNYTYDKLNRISEVSGTKGADSYYEYDFRGNRIVNYEESDFLSDDSALFEYNSENRMIYAEVGEDETEIKYSADGLRYLKKENNSDPEYYIYDEKGRLTAKADITLVSINRNANLMMFPVKQYIWGPDRVLAQIDKLTNSTYYYLYNGHGDVVQVVNTSGSIVNSYDYDIWGNFLEKTETTDNPFTYFGQTYDETTGLYYLRARYYDPTTGRFTQQDPAEDGYNWYVYGGNNPVAYADFSGKSAVLTCIIVGVVIGFVAGGVAGGVISINSYGYVKWNWVVGGALLGGVGGALIGWGAGSVIAQLGATAAATNIIKGGGASFASFETLKKFLGSPGAGNQWHHIVEQCQSNVSRAGFSSLWINNTNNVISVTKETHEMISAYYSSIVPNISGTQTIRDWLSTQTFEEQYEFGIRVLEMFGVI